MMWYRRLVVALRDNRPVKINGEDTHELLEPEEAVKGFREMGLLEEIHYVKPEDTVTAYVPSTLPSLEGKGMSTGIIEQLSGSCLF
jgi:hypothetical protein